MTSTFLFHRQPAWGLSPLYEYTVIAREGMHTVEGEYIAGIRPEVSVNEHGWVAFIATMDPGSNLFAGQAPYNPVNISLSGDARQFGFPQVNNQGVIVARELLSGNSAVRTWRINNPGDFTLLASSTLSAFSQLTLPTIGNMPFANSQPIVGFLGREGDLPFAYYANDMGERDMQDKVSGLSGTVLASFRSMAAASTKRTFVAQYSTRDDNGRIVVFSDPGDDGLWESTPIATTVGNDWLDLGTAPGISDNGKVVAFVGNHRKDGPGIYLAMATGPFTAGSTLLPAIRTTDVIAYDEAGDPITLASFDFVNRVGVIHQERGQPGLEDDCIILTFAATPSKSSVPNSVLPGQPLLFSDQQGVWMMRVDIERELDPPAGPNPLRLHPTTPVSVIQEGDLIDGALVESLTLYDPLAIPFTDADGLPRIPHFGDHYVAFAALTDAGTKVVRAAMLDTDGDGLMDHWETRGIDMDHDGQADLKLHRMGADPLRKDLFIEIDWLTDRTSGSYKPWSNQPAPYVTHRAARTFSEAPVLNPDGTSGVTVHIDAGPGVDATGSPFSVNMPDDPFLLDGGDLVGMPGAPHQHIDVVYFGPPGSINIPGLVARNFGSIKDEYFGTYDKRARELAFKYAVLADSHSLKALDKSYVARIAQATPTEITTTSFIGSENAMQGHVVKIISGKGAGQVREIAYSHGKGMTVWPAFDEAPDSSSSLVVINGSSGRAEVHFLPGPDNHSRPANDFLMTLGGFGINKGGWLSNGMIQWRTIVHELGHTFGLRHGGTDHQAYKGNLYPSLMSYSYQLEIKSGVDSYGSLYQPDGSGPVFDDWAYIKYDFQNSAYFLGNTFGRSPGDSDENYPDPTVADYEDLNNTPVDLAPPDISISSPPGGTTIAPGGSLTVRATATDDVEVVSVHVYFDLNGDGRTEGPRETVEATPLGGGTYSAVFANVVGPFGARRILAIATDSSENLGAAASSVLAGQGAGSGTTLHESSGAIPAQPAGGQRQTVQIGPLAVPGSGRLTFSVTSTPPVRQAAHEFEQHDPAVHNIEFEGQDIQLTPVCNPPGSDPAICTSYWQATSGGALTVEILGPAVLDGDGNFLGHPAQDYTLDVSFEAVDLTPPEITITSPAAGGFVGVGQTLRVEANVTDDYGLASVVVSFDINGDGATDGAGESIAASDVGGGAYQATFPNVSGDPGARAILLRATDTSDHITLETGFVEVRVPDTEPPVVQIKSPPAGWPIEQDSTLRVEVYAYDDIELSSVTVSFDIDGNGTTIGFGETVVAEKTGVNLYSAEFYSISGPNGPRTVSVEAVDSSMNVSPASVPVTVGGVEPVTETIFTDSGHIDAQPGYWSGGSQQVIDYDPIAVPGSGTLTFIVTATPPVRQESQNIPRSDPYVRKINFNGTDYTLNPDCNDFGADPSICITTFEATEGGTLDFEILGPGTWNIWGDFSGHHAQDYTIEIQFTSVDITRPDVTVTSPELGANLDLGAPLTVELSVADEGEIASVIVSFDVDGDGDTDGFGEQLAATPTGGDDYQAAFGDLSGIPGTRTIQVMATDASFNTTRKSQTVGVGGVGGGEMLLATTSGTIPAQSHTGERQIVDLDPIVVPGMGRITIVVTATPNVRQEFQNIQRYDSTVTKINFEGGDITLTPDCNDPGSDPAVCVSVWDAPADGVLDAELLGPATYNTWGEFSGHGEQDYTIEVLFLPGPTVTEVSPATGSVGGHESVTVRGSGFGYNAVVLFSEVPATDVAWISSEELTCTTPPGVPGSVSVKVLNPDQDNLSWNYGGPYGLFGELEDGFTYQAAPPPQATQAERLLGTYKGYFPAVGSEDPQQQASFDFTIPGAGRLRFEAYAFIPILNPIPGPFDDSDNLEWHNESTAVRSFVAGNGASHWVEVACSDLSYPYGPVICNSTRIVDSAAAGSGSLTLKGPARWNAFWRQFGEYVMISAPAQNWSLAVWYAEPPSLASVGPTSGTEAGGSTVILTGENFAEGIQVFFGGAPAANVVVSATNRLTCKTPPGLAGQVAVEIDLLGMTAALPNAFTYVADEQRQAITGFTFDPQTENPTVGVQTLLGRTYQLQRNEDLTDPFGWVNIGGQVSGSGWEEFVTDTTPPYYSPRVYYRFVIRGYQP